jgi:hypothetical protein
MAAEQIATDEAAALRPTRRFRGRTAAIVRAADRAAIASPRWQRAVGHGARGGGGDLGDGGLSMRPCKKAQLLRLWLCLIRSLVDNEQSTARAEAPENKPDKPSLLQSTRDGANPLG